MVDRDAELDAATLQAHGSELARGRRFDFGANWSRFASSVDSTTIDEAVRSLRELLPPDRLPAGRLEGVRVLDAGCGSGLFSLAALRLGANVTAFDFDPNSVRTTRGLIDDWASATEAERFTLLHGSVLDPDFLARLGDFDIVYSWGVLHHTGSMWEACRLVGQRIAPGGALALALYHDTGAASTVWWYLKRIYVGLPALLRPILAVLLLLPIEAVALLRSLLRGSPADYVRRWTEYRSLRGMSRWHDHLDWVGGFPYEAATPDEVIAFCETQGLAHLRTTPAVAWGNNEFVFERVEPTAAG